MSGVLLLFFCVKNFNQKHFKFHFCFPTLNISKSQMKELISLLNNYNKQKELINEEYFKNILNEIHNQKKDDLLKLK